MDRRADFMGYCLHAVQIASAPCIQGLCALADHREGLPVQLAGGEDQTRPARPRAARPVFTIPAVDLLEVDGWCSVTMQRCCLRALEKDSGFVVFPPHLQLASKCFPWTIQQIIA